MMIQVKHAGGSLREYMYSCDATHTRAAAETFVSIFQDFHRTDRVTMPLLKTLDQLMSSGCFGKLSESDWYDSASHSWFLTLTLHITVACNVFLLHVLAFNPYICWMFTTLEQAFYFIYMYFTYGFYVLVILICVFSCYLPPLSVALCLVSPRVLVAWLVSSHWWDFTITLLSCRFTDGDLLGPVQTACDVNSFTAQH